MSLYFSMTSLRLFANFFDTNWLAWNSSEWKKETKSKSTINFDYQASEHWPSQITRICHYFLRAVCIGRCWGAPWLSPFRYSGAKVAQPKARRRVQTWDDATPCKEDDAVRYTEISPIMPFGKRFPADGNQRVWAVKATSAWAMSRRPAPCGLRS